MGDGWTEMGEWCEILFWIVTFMEMCCFVEYKQ